MIVSHRDTSQLKKKKNGEVKEWKVREKKKERESNQSLKNDDVIVMQFKKT